MSADSTKPPVPELLDAWRMVSARRGLEGRAPLASLPRLAGSLVDTDGEVAYTLDFGSDEPLRYNKVNLTNPFFVVYGPSWPRPTTESI